MLPLQGKTTPSASPPFPCKAGIASFSNQISSVLKHTFLIPLIFFTFGIEATRAQRIVTELESNTDLSMDSRPDSASTDKKKKVVPNDVVAWHVDEKYGNIIPTHVDTLHHLFMNTDLPEGIKGQYTTLGNVGSPRLSRIFMQRPPTPDFLFTSPYDMFFVDTDHFRFYNTKSPFMNIAYNWNGSRDTGSDHVKATYTNNIGKKANLGAIFDYIYGRGFYANQSTGFMNASTWASYIDDKYSLHFYYQHNFMKNAENGGIEDMGYITNPENMAKDYATNDIPTMLNSTWNRQEHDIFFLQHHRDFGFYREDIIDSTTTKQVFVPVSRIFHSVKLQNMMRNYRSYYERENYHSYTYLPGDTTQDKTRNLAIRSNLGVSLCEGFNKWAIFGVNAFIGYEHKRYTLPDTTLHGGIHTNTDGIIDKQTYTEHNIIAGGQIIRSQGKTINYTVDGEFVLAGKSIGQFELKGHAEANIPLLGDTAKAEANAYIKNLMPSFYYRHYHSKHAWWDRDMDKEMRQRVEGIITIPHTSTVLTVGMENIKNYCYFQNNGIMRGEGDNATLSNNVTAMQSGDNIQVISANLQQNFRLGILNWENDITYQTCTNKDILPLPTLSVYTNLYLKFSIAKVLKTEFGADMKYFSEYYAPDYSPVMNTFMNQNPAGKVKIGNYPLISVYANFDLKRTRFYVMYHHANQSDGRYLWAPGYPMNPSSMRFGLSWNYYD